MKIKVTVRLSFIQPGAFLHRHELREVEIEAENHSEIVKKAFNHVLDTEKNLPELFGMDIYTYSQDEEIAEELSEADIHNILSNREGVNFG